MEALQVSMRETDVVVCVTQPDGDGGRSASVALTPDQACAWGKRLMTAGLSMGGKPSGAARGDGKAGRELARLAREFE